MKILFVSENCSTKKYSEIDKQRSRALLPAQQKYYNLLLEGLSSIQGVFIECLSVVPVSASCHHKLIWRKEYEVINRSLSYTYLPFVNGKVLRLITQYFSTYSACKKWINDNESIEDKIIISDSTITQCVAAILKSVKRKQCRSIGIITDIPRFIEAIGIKNRNILMKYFIDHYNRFAEKNIKKHDAYIFLTKYMNDLINNSGRPYIIVEGSVEYNLDKIENKLEDKISPRSIVYAGGIYEKFGVVKLARAFSKTDLNDVELKIYGSGKDINLIESISKYDKRIQYMGILPLEEIIKCEIKATVLINPRPSNEEFTKYSFPSKTTEYLVSGTPVISTRLQGIPKEYDNYIFWIENESEDGIKEMIEKVFKIKNEELHKFGNKAKQYVIREKNNIRQSKRIVDFINHVLR